MSEKPILFNGEMVRAILDGRKTQTRRVIKPQPPREAVICGPEWFTLTITLVGKDGEERPGNPVYGFYSDDGEWGIKCPYQPGDILWVRETWQKCGTTYIYRADKENRGSAAYYNEYANLNKGWRPSIHMPREAARLFLRVVNVRAERLQDITESDAKAEGCDANIPDGMPSAVAWFHEVWERLHANRGFGWNTNPWVWVYTFEVIEDAD